MFASSDASTQQEESLLENVYQSVGTGWEGEELLVGQPWHLCGRLFPSLVQVRRMKDRTK